MRFPSWLVPARVPPLGEREIHVWRCRVELPAAALARLQGLLDPGEEARASRLRHAESQRRFVVGRGGLRELAGAYLDREPRELRFTPAGAGKPSLAYPPAGRRLRFNLSHAGNLILLAFARDREVGVDVERVAPEMDWVRVAARFFPVAEHQRLLSLPRGVRLRSFFICWSCKEAVGKASGRGIGRTLSELAVPLPLGADPASAELRGESDGRRWCFRRLLPGRGYVGALAWEAAAERAREELTSSHSALPPGQAPGGVKPANSPRGRGEGECPPLSEGSERVIRSQALRLRCLSWPPSRS
jgi:4'-phosphopantetheinyl transferase